MTIEHNEAPNGRHFKSWTDGVVWDINSREQVENLLRMSFVEEVAVMPDTHWGMGGPVGVAVRFNGAVIPAVVGVDIGCGMQVARLEGITEKDLDHDALVRLRGAIEAVIPHGLTQGRDAGSWGGDVPPDIVDHWKYITYDGEHTLEQQYEALLGRFDPETEQALRLTPFRNSATPRHRDPLSQLGTLGTGNHFFEVSVDETGAVWAIVHSGSRGAGNRIGDWFTKKAGDLAAKWFIPLPKDDRNLAYLPSGEPEYWGYLDFMKWAQGYALMNRDVMMRRALNIAFPRALKRAIVKAEGWDIHHNYLNTSSMVARKGAVHIQPGGLAVIPGAMGARTYIVRGKEGLSQSMFTCSHGAGRAMSRTAAEKYVTLEQHQADLKDLVCDNSAGTLDETTRAYKNIDAVIKAQDDLVEPIHILTAKLCVKGVGTKRK